MKTYISLLLLFSLIYIAYDADIMNYCGENPVNKEECWSKHNEGNHCCYVEIENNQKNKIRNCAEVTQNEYENIKDYIEGVKMFLKMEGSKIKKFDCNANYIKVGFGLLLLLF